MINVKMKGKGEGRGSSHFGSIQSIQFDPIDGLI